MTAYFFTEGIRKTVAPEVMKEIEGLLWKMEKEGYDIKRCGESMAEHGLLHITAPHGWEFDVLEPLDICTVSEMVRFMGEAFFDGSVKNLELRMAKLGWRIKGGGSFLEMARNRNSGRIEVEMTTSSTMRVERNANGAMNLLKEVERAKLCKILEENSWEFVEAGILVQVRDDTLEFRLQENDPVLKRDLIKANVDKLYSLAKAWFALKK